MLPTVALLAVLGAPPAAGPVLVLDLAAIDTSTALADQATRYVAEALGGREEWPIRTQAEVLKGSDADAPAALQACAGDPTCVVGVLPELSVDYIVLGSVGQLGLNTTVTASLIATKTAATVSHRTVVIQNATDLPAEVRGLIRGLMGWETSPAEQVVLAAESGADLSFAVLDLVPSGIEASTVETLTELMVNELKTIEGSRIIARADITAMLKFESDKQILGCADDSECLAEIGGALGVSYLIAGNVGRVGEIYVIALRVLEPGRAKVLNRVTESFRGLDEQLPAALRHAVFALIGQPLTGDAALQLRASEADVELFIDGKALGLVSALPKGELPTALPAGRHALRLSKEDYKDWTSDVYLTPGAPTQINATLQPLPTEWYESWVFWTVSAGIAALAAGAAITAVAVTSGGGDETPTFPGLQVGLPDTSGP